MANHAWTILCSRATVDKETNNMSIFDVIERITFLAPPQTDTVVFPIHAELVTLWVRSDYEKPETAIGRFTLKAQDNTVLGSAQFEINLGDPNIRTRTIARMNSLPFRGEGIYNFVIEIQHPESGEWEVVSTLPLEVLLEKTV